MSGSPAPHTRQTIAPSPQAVLGLRPARLRTLTAVAALVPGTGGGFAEDMRALGPRVRFGLPTLRTEELQPQPSAAGHCGPLVCVSAVPAIGYKGWSGLRAGAGVRRAARIEGFVGWDGSTSARSLCL